MPDYLLPDGMTAAAASRALADRLGVLRRASRVCGRAYYDTFDGLMRAAGLSAVWEDGQLALMESDGGRVRARAQVAKPAKPLFAWDLEDGPMRESLSALIDVRALLPVVEIECRERSLDVLDAERKTVVRMCVQQPRLGRRRLAPRLQVTGVRGYDAALARVRRALVGELGFRAAAGSLVDDAVLASGGTPGGTSAKVHLRLAPTDRADRAAAVVLRALLRVIEDNVPGAIADLDSEFLHDFRVSVRRTRAVQRELRGVFPPDELQRFRAEFRWLQRATGDARDLDVYVLEFDEMRSLVPERDRARLDPLLLVLRQRQKAARRRMVRALRSQRTSSLLADWAVVLDRLPGLPLEGRPDAAAPIETVAGARIVKVYRRMAKMGQEIGPESPSTDYHELRKLGKELRYLLELFGAPLFPAEVVRPMVRTLKSLQDVLGRHQDREVQVTMLGSLGPELITTGDGRAALLATGMLIERLEADQCAARKEFAPRFAAFASRRQRKLVKDTFG